MKRYLSAGSRLSLITATLLITSGCGAHMVRIERTRPARLHLSTERKLGVQVDPPPKQPAGAEVGNAFNAVLNATKGQFIQTEMAVEPVRNELYQGFKTSQFTLVDASGADTVVRVVPTEWKYRGPPPLRPGNGTGTLSIRLEVLDKKGNPTAATPMFKETYWASAEARNEAEAIFLASQRVARVFLQDLEPVRVWDKVEMDTSDPATKTGIELVDAGRFDAAHAAFTDVVASSPNSAPALYNLAIMEEARGEYDKAEAHLGQAAKIGQKPLYYTALERVRRAKAETAQLMNPR